MNLLTLCGSLRARSSNRAVLEAFSQLVAPPLVVTHSDHLAALPHFNPDLDRDDLSPPSAVAAFRAAIAAADALVISTPEYAHGLPGAFKNALDWLVSDPAFADKPIAILHIDRNSTFALDSLREILRTMSARLIEPACVGLRLTTNQVDAAAILARDDLRQLLQQSVDALAANLRQA